MNKGSTRRIVPNPGQKTSEHIFHILIHAEIVVNELNIHECMN